MSDKWFYQHAGAVHGPVSAEQLRGLIEMDGLNPEDLIWPESTKAVAAVRADAALPFPTPVPVEPRDFVPVPPPQPEWVRELRDAIAACGEVAKLPPPSAQSWLPDVRDAEQKAQHGDQKKERR